MGKQGFTCTVGPPRKCACGVLFRPSMVIERRGGTKGVTFTCPACVATEREKRRRRDQKG